MYDKENQGIRIIISSVWNILLFLLVAMFISRRAAENAKLASRFALAVGLAECWRPVGKHKRSVCVFALSASLREIKFRVLACQRREGDSDSQS